METKKRESTKARCYNFLAMCCDGYLKTKIGTDSDKQAAHNYRLRISLICEILKISDNELNFMSIVKKYRPDLFAQPFYDGYRKYVA
jgi:translation initiation factor 2B subunit (eIF-2B alpha/beta/delta family)